MATNTPHSMDAPGKSEDASSSDYSPDLINCPKPLLPDGFITPTFPNDYYTKLVPKDQLDQLDGIKLKALNAAAEKKEGDYAKALEDFDLSKDAFAKADRDKASAKHLLTLKSKNNKTEFLRVYKEKLLTLLPKGGLSSGNENSPIEGRVPADKLAISIAELNKSLTDEDLDYLKKKKDINLKFEDSEALWNKAEIAFREAVCEARLTETQAINQAEVIWRTSISDLLKALKN